MKVALIGSGGREHALAWKLSQSPRLERLCVLPGNPGTLELAENIAIDPSDTAAIVAFAKAQEIDLVVIGPEDPLANGLADVLRKENIAVFGPGKAAAQLEADKWFAKELMRQQAIPTAEAKSFTHASQAKQYVQRTGVPLVVKATGLAKGKGVSVCYREQDAFDAINASLSKKVFGEAGNRVVIEEMLKGTEVSVLAFVAGNHVYLMETCQDHKTVEDDNIGPMTGGMGAFCPSPTLTPKMLQQIERDVFVPALDGLRRDDIDFRGVLYAGLMVTPGGAKVLEFNVRFGDPETQPLMMRLKTDLLDIMFATATGTLEKISLEWDPRPAVCVVATSRGYPGKYQNGLPISGLNEVATDHTLQVFQGGTKKHGDQLVTDGGRVLSVCAMADTLDAARDKAYAALATIKFDGMHYRRDIARPPRIFGSSPTTPANP